MISVLQSITARIILNPIATTAYLGILLLAIFPSLIYLPILSLVGFEDTRVRGRKSESPCIHARVSADRVNLSQTALHPG
jgi:hypothetical protein